MRPGDTIQPEGKLAAVGLRTGVSVVAWFRQFGCGTIPRPFVLTLMIASGSCAPAVQAADSTNLEPVRFAFSAQMFTDVNENDARASVKAWAMAIARERHVPMSTEPVIVSGTPQLKQALLDRTIDGAAVTTEEYLGLEPEFQSTNLFMSCNGGEFTEEYLLLVNANSNITNWGGLRGRKIILFDNVRASLAPMWLEVVLADHNLGASADYFGQLQKVQKLVKVVLSVFFHQQDACIVTRRGFDTMCELNPQVRTQLRVLAASPKVVPSVGFMRRTYVSPLRETLLAALRGLEKSTAGTQVLTLFQSDQLREAPASLLDSARLLLATHQRLRRTADQAAAANLVQQVGATPTIGKGQP